MCIFICVSGLSGLTPLLGARKHCTCAQFYFEATSKQLGIVQRSHNLSLGGLGSAVRERAIVANPEARGHLEATSRPL